MCILAEYNIIKLKNALNNFLDTFITIRNSRVFNVIVVTVILASAVYAGMSTYDLPSEYESVLDILDYSITVFFLIEILIRLLAERPFYHFFKSGWNIFDFIIISVSLIPMGGTETVFVARLLRLIRILRIITIIPDFKRIIDNLLETLPKVGYIILLMFIFFIFGQH